MTLPPRAAEILLYWFGKEEPSAAYFQERNRFWFMGGEQVDSEIREKFGTDVELAASGKLSAWEEEPRGALALIVLLDQFALNVHRGEATGYLYSELSLPLAREAIRKGWQEGLGMAERVFLFMPLEHSESLLHQEESVRHFRALAEKSPAALAPVMAGFLDFAVRHQEVVKRYGRFPHRNEALGRESSAEELAFLASPHAPF